MYKWRMPIDRNGLQIKLNEKLVNFEIDTGAMVNCFPLRVFKELVLSELIRSKKSKKNLGLKWCEKLIISTV